MVENALRLVSAFCKEGQRPFRPWVENWVRRARHLAAIRDADQRERAAETLNQELWEFGNLHDVAFPVLLVLDERRKANGELASGLTSDDDIPNALRTLTEEEFFRRAWTILRLRRRHNVTCSLRGKRACRGVSCSCPYWFPSNPPDNAAFRLRIQQIVAEELETTGNPDELEAAQARLNARVQLAYAEEIASISTQLDQLKPREGIAGAVALERLRKTTELEGFRQKLQNEMVGVGEGRVPDAEAPLEQPLNMRRLEALGDLWIALYSEPFLPFPPPRGSFRALLNGMRKEGNLRLLTGAGGVIPEQRTAGRSVVIRSTGLLRIPYGTGDAETTEPLWAPAFTKCAHDELEARITLDQIRSQLPALARATVEHFYNNPDGQLRDWKQAGESLGLKAAVVQSIRKQLDRCRDQLRAMYPLRGDALGSLPTMPEGTRRGLAVLRRSRSGDISTRGGPCCLVCWTWVRPCEHCSRSATISKV